MGASSLEIDLPPPQAIAHHKPKWLFRLIPSYASSLERAAAQLMLERPAWAFWIEVELFAYELGPPVRKKGAPEI